jgi:hypothetical protein
MSPERVTYTKEIPVEGSYDVVVCGGGPAGCAAALSARRAGMRVLLVEAQGQLGGMGTSGLVSHWLGGRTQEGDWVVGGIFKSLAEEAAARRYALIPTLEPDRVYQPHGWLPWFVHGIPMDPYRVSQLLDERIEREGIELLLETQCVDTLVRGQRISRVMLHNKSGLFAVSGGVFVDATGDADMAAASGCEYEVGREEDGLTTPASLSFHLYNVDHNALAEYIEEHRTPKFREKIRELRATGEWPFPYDIFITVRLVQHDVAMVNTMRLPGVNGIDGASRTRGLMQGRREALQLLSIFRKHFPGLAGAEIKAIAPTLGIRETRRIKGAFRLTTEDLTRGRRFEDTVGFSIYGWDLPDPKRPSVQPLVDESTGGYINKVDKALSTPIPYRVMVPQPIENLVTPGRSISVERDVLGPLRVMAPSMAMGEAAGTAAALMMENGVSAAAVDIGRLKERLRSCGAIVDEEALPPISPRVDP